LEELLDIDDDASKLFAEAGLVLAFERHHPFVVAEAMHWGEAIRCGLAHVAVDEGDEPIGFATLRLVDGEPYLDQISVRCSQMRRGVG